MYFYKFDCRTCDDNETTYTSSKKSGKSKIDMDKVSKCYSKYSLSKMKFI